MDSEKLVIEKDGKKVECEVLFSFNCEDNGRTYIGYTDHSTNEKGEENIYSLSYFPSEQGDYYEPVTSEKELKMVQEVIETIRESD